MNKNSNLRKSELMLLRRLKGSSVYYRNFWSMGRTSMNLLMKTTPEPYVYNSLGTNPYISLVLKAINSFGKSITTVLL